MAAAVSVGGVVSVGIGVLVGIGVSDGRGSWVDTVASVGTGAEVEEISSLPLQALISRKDAVRKTKGLIWVIEGFLIF